MIKLEELVRILRNTPGRVEGVLHALGKNLGPRYVRAAKKRFGKYQPAVGPFPGWAELSENTIAEKISGGFPTPSPLYRGAGWDSGGPLKESIEYQIEVKRKELVITLGSNDDRMYWHEQGFWNARSGTFVPPRPVIGPAAYEVTERVQPIITRAMVVAMSPELSQEIGIMRDLASALDVSYGVQRTNSRARR